jgi:hypothetical protein
MLNVSLEFEQQEEYLQLYLSSLRACGVSESETRIEDARRDVKLMTLLLYQYSWMLMQAKQVGATQGNTQADMKKWGDRVHLSAWDATSDPESLAAELKIPVKLIDDFRLQERAEHIDAYVYSSNTSQFHLLIFNHFIILFSLSLLNTVTSPKLPRRVSRLSRRR